MRLDIVILAVENLARARAFYESVFGWPIVVSAPVYVELDAGSARVGLYDRRSFGKNTGETPPAAAPNELSRTELYVRVDSLPRAIARLEAAQARCLSPLARRPWGDDAAYFADPDGNVVVVAAAA
jgi:catechol 2,3-dioxygenase-like lactoylglutathione lyase family enzyme